MDEEPLVSYVICTFNSEEFIEENLQSIKKQDYDNQEIIVVDNCSSDSTREIIEENFPEVKLIVMPNSDYGACETFNIGFETAKGEYIAIMDDDVEIEKKWTLSLVNKMQKENKLGAITPEIKDPNGLAVSKNAEIDFFHGCGSLARKSAIKEAGYYDERFFIYFNEPDLSARLLNLDYKILATKDVTTLHKNNKSKERVFSSFDTFYQTRNKIWYFWKYFDIKNAVFHSLAHLLERGRKAAEDQKIKAYIRAIFSALKGFNDVRKKREYCKDIEYKKWRVQEINSAIKRRLTLWK